MQNQLTDVYNEARPRIAINLRVYRAIRSLTQGELGELAGISAKTIGEVERESGAGMSVATLCALAQALRVEPGAFFNNREKD